MSEHDKEYLRLLNDVLYDGEERQDRTGVGTLGTFGEKMVFDLSSSFPLLVTKSVHWKSVVIELLWFLRGDTNVRWLQERGVSIWDDWADENGDLGPVYGKQWRSWPGKPLPVTITGRLSPGEKFIVGPSMIEQETVDQIKRLVESLKTNPQGRRHVVSAWNPAEVDNMALPPCHCLFQFWVSQADNTLHCQLYQRSADVFLGVPFNIASYALLTCILADTLGFNRGKFHWVGGDVHLYKNHVRQAVEQLNRVASKVAPPAPILEKITKLDVFSLELKDIVLTGYEPWAKIPAPVAV